MAYTQRQNNFLWILKVSPVDERGLFLADCISWFVMSIGEFICEEIINKSIQCPAVLEGFVCSNATLWAACSEFWPVLEKNPCKKRFVLSHTVLWTNNWTGPWHGCEGSRSRKEGRGDVWRWQWLDSLKLSRCTGIKETLHWESAPWLLHKRMIQSLLGDVQTSEMLGEAEWSSGRKGRNCFMVEWLDEKSRS